MKIKTLLVCLLLILTFSLDAWSAGKLYRYQDEHGNWKISDKVPPEDAVFERSELNEDGRTIKIHEAAKTDEQIEKEALLKQIQKGKAGLLSELQKSDAVLMKTFQREEDIDNTLTAKLKTLESRQKLATDQLAQQRNQLLAHQKKAAGFERDGKPIPEKVMSDIKNTRTVISDYEEEVANIDQQKVELKRQSDLDKARFSQLKAYGNQKRTIDDSGIPSLEIGQITCSKADTCNQLWPKALDFAKKVANTRIVMESNNLLLTSPATTGDDRAISLSRLMEDDKTVLYMDIRCKDSELGRETCKSEATKKIISDFNRLTTANGADRSN